MAKRKHGDAWEGQFVLVIQDALEADLATLRAVTRLFVRRSLAAWGARDRRRASACGKAARRG